MYVSKVAPHLLPGKQQSFLATGRMPLQNLAPVDMLVQMVTSLGLLVAQDFILPQISLHRVLSVLLENTLAPRPLLAPRVLLGSTLLPGPPPVQHAQQARSLFSLGLLLALRAILVHTAQLALLRLMPSPIYAPLATTVQLPPAKLPAQVVPFAPRV